MTNARFLWAWILVLFILAVGCSGDSHVGESEPLGQTRQALSSEQERVLQFESPADWTTSAGTLSAASVVAQGSGALAVQRPQAWTEVCSKPLSSLGAVGSSLTVALWQQATPIFGTVQLFVRIPSLGHHDTAIQPPITLHNKAAGVFHTLTFPLGTTASALSGTYSDLRLCFVINASAGLYVLDDARFSGLTTASSSTTTTTSSSITSSGGTSSGGTSSGGTSHEAADGILPTKRHAQLPEAKRLPQELLQRGGIGPLKLCPMLQELLGFPIEAARSHEGSPSPAEVAGLCGLLAREA